MQSKKPQRAWPFPVPIYEHNIEQNNPYCPLLICCYLVVNTFYSFCQLQLDYCPKHNRKQRDVNNFLKKINILANNTVPYPPRILMSPSLRAVLGVEFRCL